MIKLDFCFPADQFYFRSLEMKLFVSCCAFILSFALSKAEDISSFIRGGENATIDEFPYMAGIVDKGAFETSITCGGAIINARSILTVRT